MLDLLWPANNDTISIIISITLTIILLFRMYLGRSVWTPKQRSAYIHEWVPSELG
jgi:hypothetical protein